MQAKKFFFFTKNINEKTTLEASGGFVGDGRGSGEDALERAESERLWLHRGHVF